MAFVASCASAADPLSAASHPLTTSTTTTATAAAAAAATARARARTRTRWREREREHEEVGITVMGEGMSVGHDGKEIAVVWFRGEDLRIDDHPALSTALKEGRVVAALVTPTVAQFRSSFFRGCLADLRESLRHLRGELFIRGFPSFPSGCVGGEAEEQEREQDKERVQRVVDFVVETGAKYLYAHQGIRKEDVREEEAVSQILQRRLDVQTRLLWTGTLRAPDELPFAIASAPEECDEFSCRVATLPILPPLPAPQSCDNPAFLSHLPAGPSLAAARAPHLVADVGESAGLRRVQDFVVGRSLASVSSSSASSSSSSSSMDHCCDKKNKNIKPIDTKFGRLSPFLATGCVSPRRLWHEVVRRAPSPSLRRFCAELDLTLRDFTRLMTLKYGVVPA